MAHALYAKQFEEISHAGPIDDDYFENLDWSFPCRRFITELKLIIIRQINYMTNLILERWFLVTLTLLISFSLCFIRRLIGSNEVWWNIHRRQKMSATSPLYGTKVMKCICLVHLFFHSVGCNCPINDNDLKWRKKLKCFGMKEKISMILERGYPKPMSLNTQYKISRTPFIFLLLNIF